MSKYIYIILLIWAIACKSADAQLLTREDSLLAGVESKDQSTIIGGYGEAAYTNNTTLEEAEMNLTRAVLFVGHRFSNRISFFSELEVEDAKVDGSGGELALEQCFLKFDLNNEHYLTAGLFIPRIGILNENHLPTTYFGNRRPVVERYIIPSTWRELGIAAYGKVPGLQGLDYSAAIVNGLNSEEINAEKGLRDARFEGREATANNLAVTGSLLYYWKSLRVQVSGYYGGSVGLSSREADSLQLESGIFGTPVSLVEANFSYQKKGWSLKGLFTVANIPDANRINRAYAKNCPEQMTGYYAEAGYNVLRLFNDSTRKNLSLFFRYESVQINDKMPENGIRNEMNNQTFLTAGINYTPVHGVVIKADVNLKHTGVPNPVLQSIPFPEALPYEQDQTIFSLGLGYSF